MHLYDNLTTALLRDPRAYLRLKEQLSPLSSRVLSWIETTICSRLNSARALTDNPTAIAPTIRTVLYSTSRVEKLLGLETYQT